MSIETQTTGDNAETTAEIEYIQRIQAARERVRVAELDMNRTKAAAKQARNAWEEAVNELNDAIDDGPEYLPLFDGPQKPAADMDWRETPVEELGLPEKTAAILREAEIPTIGDIAAHAEQFDLTDIPGIGPAKAEEIEQALERFWAEHPEYCESAEDAEEGGDTDNDE